MTVLPTEAARLRQITAPPIRTPQRRSWWLPVIVAGLAVLALAAGWWPR